MTRQQRSTLVKRIAEQLGFARCGICGVEPIIHTKYLLDWLHAGRHGEMTYLARHAETRLDPSRLLPRAVSVIVVAWLYRVHEEIPGEPAYWARATLERGECAAPGESGCGRIARYAWGRDYHRVITGRLRKLIAALQSRISEPFDYKICVDTAPLMERELAQRAGIGWIGKNAMLMNRALGSYFCLGEVVTTLALAVDEPIADDGCGRCDRCLQACPTGALIGPRQIDARRCISYLTIEHREEISADLRNKISGWIFGCDMCQEACPYNGPRAAVSIEPDTLARWPAGRVDLDQILSWDERDWDRATRGRALRRAGLKMWHRNAEILRGSLGS